MYRLIVVDDSATKIVAVKRAFRGIPNVEIDIAKDLHSFMEKMECTSYDLVIMDGHLPDGTGKEAAREMRKRGSIPVLLFSTDAEDMFVPDPFDAAVSPKAGEEKLLTEVLSLLKGRR